MTPSAALVCAALCWTALLFIVLFSPAKVHLIQALLSSLKETRLCVSALSIDYLIRFSSAVLCVALRSVQLTSALVFGCNLFCPQSEGNEP